MEIADYNTDINKQENKIKIKKEVQSNGWWIDIIIG